MASIFIFALSICCILSASIAQAQFLLVQTWPSGYCGNKTLKCNITDRFVIHGLWPVNGSGKVLETRKRKRLPNVSSILSGSLRHEMEYFWPGLTMADETIWQHEWEKHGSLSSLTALSYFEKTIDLRRKMDLLSKLEDKGITPTVNGSIYPRSAYKNALISQNYTKLRCKRGHILWEVMLCVDSTATNFTPCNNHTLGPKENCGQNISFLLK